MQVKDHIIYGSAASAVLIPFFGIKTVFFLAGSLAIDLDHYVDFLYYSRFRDWNIKNMFRFHYSLSGPTQKGDIYALEAFHTVEFFLALIALAVYFHSTELFLTAGGMFFHLILDLIQLYQWKQINARAFSFFEYWLQRKKMKRTGKNPEKIFADSYLSISESKSKIAKEKKDEVPKEKQI